MNFTWQNAAACHGWTELFFGPEGEQRPEREIRERKARVICSTCPVQLDCLRFAVARPEKYGTWGGKNEDEREPLRRRYLRNGAAA